jgi:SAM-dependent methyltransferase
MTKFESKRGLLVHIGCGLDKQPNFLGMDLEPLDGVDLVHDWRQDLKPLEDGSVLTILATHVVERVDPANGHFLDWMDECWRVLKPRGQLATMMPYAGSRAYWQDPCHVNPCTEATAFYLDPEHPSGLYQIYHPKPWAIEANLFHREGQLEWTLRKREEPND